MVVPREVYVVAGVVLCELIDDLSPVPSTSSGRVEQEQRLSLAHLPVVDLTISTGHIMVCSCS